MIKKIASLLLVVMALFTVASCAKDADLELPDLTGKNKQDVVNILSGLGLKTTIEDVINVDVADGYFLSYGEGFEAGQEIEPGTEVVVQFAKFANVLPDLTGMTSAEIYSAFNKFPTIIVEIQTLATNDVEEGLFVEYENGKVAGDILNDGADIVVYIAEELIIPNTGLLIAKVFDGTEGSNMVELYNATDETIDLSNFSLTIYKRLVTSTLETPIALTGTLDAGEVFTIVGAHSSETHLALADMVSDDLYFVGREALALTYYNGVNTDVFGTIGNGLQYANDRTFVRHETIGIATDVFALDQWGVYAKDNYEMFGAHPVAYPEVFYLGTEYLDLDYFTEPGGVTLQTYVDTYDGDTSYFSPDFLNTLRVRYVGIDTPEMSTGAPGMNAKNFTDQILKNASVIYIQHDPTTGIYDTYERSLGLVWADGQLLNYLLVKNGHSQNNYSDPDQTMIFNGVSLDQWFKNAEAYAQANHLGMWENS